MDIDSIGRSWDMLADKHEGLINLFYERLFSKYPHYKPLFPSSMNRQMEKVLKTLALVARVDEPEIVHAQMIRLGDKHRQFNLTQQDMLNFKQTFLEVLGEYCTQICPQVWNQECVESWNEVFDLHIIPYMVQGLEHSISKSQLKRIINLQTTADNQFLGTVVSIKQEGLSADVVIKLQGGDQLVSRITSAGLANLNLKVGTTQVYALIRPSLVMLTHAETGLQFSTRNQFCGRVISTEKGNINARVTLKLRSGNIFQALVSNETLEELDIKEDERVCCVFRAVDVILAVEKGIDAFTSTTPTIK
jgi:molybdate transport system regulatory protein